MAEGFQDTLRDFSTTKYILSQNIITYLYILGVPSGDLGFMIAVACLLFTECWCIIPGLIILWFLYAICVKGYILYIHIKSDLSCENPTHVCFTLTN